MGGAARWSAVPSSLETKQVLLGGIVNDMIMTHTSLSRVRIRLLVYGFCTTRCQFFFLVHICLALVRARNVSLTNLQCTCYTAADLVPFTMYT